ncbi:Peroxidase, family 2-domain-containing protein [Mycena alexandri]|uniref:Peroxidase, family 2-domain-containing protein n=1 Tax=Mycena alexandri TaxID=1745969 RepID=A0AAD6TGD5_9AGAR|nr:Peroxidase, family 2-domain-containing protein [Mycena alexandri]
MRYSSPSSKAIAIAVALFASWLVFRGKTPKPVDLSTGTTLAVGEWAAPGPNDVRSPCPGLNSLSNHGYLARDGRNVRAIDIITAMDEYLGIKVDFGFLQTLGAGFRGAFVFLPDFSVGLESYDALTNSHNQIEHDASFTRNDVFFDLVARGVDPESINNDAIPHMHSPAVNLTLVDFLVGFSKDGQTLTVDDIADARHGRLRSTVALNPTAVLHSKQTGGMWREAGFMSLVLGNVDGAVRVDWLREWFVNERLPTALGWQKHNAGLIDVIKYTNTYLQAEKVRNGNNVPGGTPELPIEFGSVLS